MTAPVWVRLSSVFMARAMPKSVTLTSPSGVMRMLPGFTSRCTTPWRCAKASAAATPAPMVAIWRGDGRWGSRSTAESGRPWTYSMTMKYDPSSSPQSNTGTMLGWDRLAAAWASRRNRSTKVRSTESSGNSTLSATGRSSWRSMAR
jgi:hypothetical protein